MDQPRPRTPHATLPLPLRGTPPLIIPSDDTCLQPRLVLDLAPHTPSRNLSHVVARCYILYTRLLD